MDILYIHSITSALLLLPLTVWSLMILRNNSIFALFAVVDTNRLRTRQNVYLIRVLTYRTALLVLVLRLVVNVGGVIVLQMVFVSVIFVMLPTACTVITMASAYAANLAMI